MLLHQCWDVPATTSPHTPCAYARGYVSPKVASGGGLSTTCAAHGAAWSRVLLDPVQQPPPVHKRTKPTVVLRLSRRCLGQQRQRARTARHLSGPGRPATRSTWPGAYALGHCVRCTGVLKHSTPTVGFPQRCRGGSSRHGSGCQTTSRWAWCLRGEQRAHWGILRCPEVAASCGGCSSSRRSTARGSTRLVRLPAIAPAHCEPTTNNK